MLHLLIVEFILKLSSFERTHLIILTGIYKGKFVFCF